MSFSTDGCIGTSEAAAWRIFYHAQLGTKVVVRYDLQVVDKKGDTARLKDIYPGYPSGPTLKKAPLAAVISLNLRAFGACLPEYVGVCY